MRKCCDSKCIYCYIEGDRKTARCEIDGENVTDNNSEDCQCYSEDFEEKIIG